MSTGPLSSRWEALQNRLQQTVETVTRTSRLRIARSGLDDVDPPEDIDEYHGLYRDVGLVRSNINQFVRDVTGPGVRIECDDDQTQAYFMGGEDAPDFAPEGGFIDNCAVVAGEKGKPFYPYLQTTIVQRWTRGTVLNEYVKDDPSDPEYQITGFKHIRPETVSARTYPNTNILVDPDPSADSNQEFQTEIEETNRGEAAAYVQFDDKSILGRRKGGFDRTSVYLSQNDVLKQVLDVDIGGDAADEEGVFGDPALAAIAEDAEEYQEAKRDWMRGLKTKAFGVWGAQFNKEVHDLGNEVEVTEWTGDEQEEWVDDVGAIGPGDIIGFDGSIDFKKFEGEVPELEGPLQHLANDIVSALPAPMYATAHGEQITQHVTEEQSQSYQDLVKEERQYQERSWREGFKDVAERHPQLDPSGLRVKIEPEEDESPVMSLDSDTVDRIKTYAEAVDTIEHSVSLTEEEKRQLILQLPGTPELGSLDEQPLDETDEQVQEQAAQFDRAVSDS